MNKTRFRWVAVILIVAGGVMLLLLLSGGRRGPTQVVRAVRTDGFRDAGMILVRLESPGGRRFLLRFLDRLEEEDYSRTRSNPDLLRPTHTVVYRYDADAQQVQDASTAEWGNATGSVAVCDRDHWGSARAFTIDQQNALLSFRDRPAVTAYPTALDLLWSIDGTMISVLTSDGWRIPSPIPFTGSGVTLGRRYVELLDINDSHPLAIPFELKGESGRRASSGCRTDDGRFLIYYGLDLDRLWIVEVPESVRDRKP